MGSKSTPATCPPSCLPVFLKRSLTPRHAWPELDSGHPEINLISGLDGQECSKCGRSNRTRGLALLGSGSLLGGSDFDLKLELAICNGQVQARVLGA